jgi:geranyllinalool synthase
LTLGGLCRWAEKCGISNMGFGREKTTYCYFAVAAVTTLPHDSYIRMLVAKSAIIITVADDFFDEIGSLNELEILTDAVQRYHISFYDMYHCRIGVQH